MSFKKTQNKEWDIWSNTKRRHGTFRETLQEDMDRYTKTKGRQGHISRDK